MVVAFLLLAIQPESVASRGTGVCSLGGSVSVLQHLCIGSIYFQQVRFSIPSSEVLKKFNLIW